MEAKEDYTQDGTVDFHGKPAVPSKTGKWKACAFLVGKSACTHAHTDSMIVNKSVELYIA
jgi:hypothetical protein